jgi:hypothetical protein
MEIEQDHVSDLRGESGALEASNHRKDRDEAMDSTLRRHSPLLDGKIEPIGRSLKADRLNDLSALSRRKLNAGSPLASGHHRGEYVPYSK